MNRNSWQSYISSLAIGLTSWIESRFAVSTFCMFFFFFEVLKNPLEKVYCYSSHTKLLISITAWIPVQEGFEEVSRLATAVMKALIDVSNLIFLCMYGCQKTQPDWNSLHLVQYFHFQSCKISVTNGKGSSRGLRFFWVGGGRGIKLLWMKK